MWFNVVVLRLDKYVSSWYKNHKRIRAIKGKSTIKFQVMAQRRYFFLNHPRKTYWSLLFMNIVIKWNNKPKERSFARLMYSLDPTQGPQTRSKPKKWKIRKMVHLKNTLRSLIARSAFNLTASHFQVDCPNRNNLTIERVEQIDQN